MFFTHLVPGDRSLSRPRQFPGSGTDREQVPYRRVEFHLMPAWWSRGLKTWLKCSTGRRVRKRDKVHKTFFQFCFRLLGFACMEIYSLQKRRFLHCIQWKEKSSHPFMQTFDSTDFILNQLCGVWSAVWLISVLVILESAGTCSWVTCPELMINYFPLESVRCGCTLCPCSFPQSAYCGYIR